MKLSSVQQAVAWMVVAVMTSQVVLGDVILVPTDPPTDFPTDNPTDAPTKNPTTSPTISKAPTPNPTGRPTPSPSESVSPTESLKPTMYDIPDAPTCPNNEDGSDYYPKAEWDYYGRYFYGYRFKVTKYCEYSRWSPSGSVYFNTVVDFITSGAEAKSGWLYQSAASLSGKLPAEGDVEVTNNCDGMGSKVCIGLKSNSAGTSNGAVKWVFHKEDEAFAFKEFLESFVKYGGAGWVTDGAKMCGKRPFCWDGQGGWGYGWKYGRCSVSREVTSGHCGQYDFLIDGDLSLMPDPPFYERCGDPWKWFKACISTWQCEYIDEGGEFAYGRPSRSAYRWSSNWYFKLSGNGILHHSMKWNCGAGSEGEEKARAIKDFADYLYYANLFSQNEEECGEQPTPAPSSSVEPTGSPAPTVMDAPDCSDMVTKDGVKLEGEYIKKTGSHLSRIMTPAAGGAQRRVQVDRNCAFNIRDKDWSNKKSYGLDIGAWLDAVGEEFYATKRIADGSFTPETPPIGSLSYYQCGAKYCTKLSAGPGITSDIIWETDTNTRARNFHNFIRDRINWTPKIFLTNQDGSLACGSMPYCFDSKSHTTCYIDHNSENCGQWDFVVAGDESYVENGLFRTGDSMEFFQKCTASYGCTWQNPGGSTFKYHNSVWRSVYYSWSDEAWILKLSGSSSFSGGSRGYFFECPSFEAADAMKDFATSMYDANMFWYNWKCTAPPTAAPTNTITDSPSPSPTEVPSMAPTECVDSLLSREKLNIAVVVDMSYSTYKLSFDGTPIGDVNGDGKPNTILDAEIQAVLELLKVIEDDESLTNDNTNIGLVVFDTEATYKGSFNPLDSNNAGPNPALRSELLALETHKKDIDVAVTNTGFTNFDDALDKTIDYFVEDAQDPLERTNIMIFLSDGVPNVRGDGDNENWCTNTTADCSQAPVYDPPLDWSSEPWESDELAFCHRNDETCYTNEFMGCALGIYTCQNKDPAMSYASELNKLKEWGVYNLAIGVGSGSEVEEGSALFMIDSNPNKYNGILPYQVFTTDDLSTALKNLCIENTDPPTVTPSSPPSGAPTESPAPTSGPTGAPVTGTPTALPSDTPSSTPTAGPTSGPTSGETPAPTGSPTGNPTGEPTTSPTMAPTICAYTDVDFSTPEGQQTIDEVNWEKNGFRVDADGCNTLAFTSYEGIGDALSLSPVSPMPTDGSCDTPDPEIIFTLDGTFENTMKLVLYDVGPVEGCGAVVRTQLPGGLPGTSHPIESMGTKAPETLEIPVEGVWRVIVDLCGSGSVTEVGVCRDPGATPAPIGLSPPSETSEPTPSPATPAPVTVFTKAPTSCPEDVKLLPNNVGEASYESLPITVIERTKESVKFVVSNTWTETLDYIYVQFYDLNRNEPCVMREQVTTSYQEEFEALCMSHSPVTVVGIWVSDAGALNPATDVAEIPRCCHGPEDDTNPKVQLTFEVLCYCPEDDAETA